MNLEAVFRAGMSADLSGDFWLFHTGKNKKLVGSHRKIREHTSPKYYQVPPTFGYLPPNPADMPSRGLTTIVN
jgi:hypothetical protein